MASALYAVRLLDMWAVWNVRGFMILSLSIQLLLAIVSPLRTKTSNRWVILMIWSTYFLSDWAAMFAFGLITNARFKNPTSPLEVDQDLLAFWSAILLIHLGGPDSITAYALEDNALWIRHLVGLVVQTLAFLNIFIKTLPDNKLRVPTILIAIAGIIKYGEKTRALYLASLENLKESVLQSRRLHLESNSTSPQGASTQSTIGANNNGQGTPENKLEIAFHYFQIFKGLVVEMMPEHSQWLESRDCFLKKDARATFEILKMELKLFYEVFYTKVLAANSAWGALIRILAFYNVLVALIMFCLIQKGGMHGVDVRITYTLLAGVIALDSASEILLVGSNLSRVNASYAQCQALGHGLVLFLIVGAASMCMLACFARLCCKFAFREWSESTGAVSILARAFEESCPRKGSKLSDCWRNINGKINDKMGVVILTKLPYQWKYNFRMELWDFVFNELREKALPADDADKVRAVYEARGEGPLSIGNLGELRRFVDDYEFEHSILIWHCATDICFHVEPFVPREEINIGRIFGKVLSDYMTYLLIKQQKLMSPVAGVEQIRYSKTLAEAKDIGKGQPTETMEQFCKNIQDKYAGTAESGERGLRGKSVLRDACALANILKQKGTAKWDMISKVWVEVLLYAAGHCGADSHVRLLSEGEELITFVWLLMAHMGIIARFPKE